MSVKNFAVTGVAGFVAPRHLKAIHDTGNRARRRRRSARRRRRARSLRLRRALLHRVRALRPPPREAAPRPGAGARRLRVDLLAELPARRAHAHGAAGRRRCDLREAARHQPLESRRACRSSSARPAGASTRCCSCVCIRRSRRSVKRLRSAPARRHVVQLSYLTARGRWYDVSWKGVDERSGGIVINIGIHFFDLLVWLFGPVERAEVHLREGKRAAGTMALQNADVQWYLSAEADGPAVHAASPAARRRSDRSSSTASRSSSVRASPICIRACMKRCWPDAASASPRRGRRSSCRIGFVTRRSPTRRRRTRCAPP